ncbi:F-box protein At5g07610-like [Cornus florida]|uniref:F-box protein At5g07610-like n=1 Tax=Cornus florida TaxID=4283 RepID=UPI00289CA156|nr:F-box protein At5g07610-like [Cornus florida]
MRLFKPPCGLGLFPDDVLVEILCRLPEKPLARLKCVCKSWDYLISVFCLPRVSLPLCGLFFRTYALPPHMPLITTDASDSSRDAFYSNLQSPDNGELIDYVSVEGNSGIGDGGGGGGCVDSEFLVNLPFHSTCAHDFLDSCNGLFLFFNASDCRYYVCNPVMRQYVPIPKARCHQTYCYAALAFNPSESLCYRVVRFAQPLKERKLLLDIYSSDTELWVRHLVQIDSCLNERIWITPSVYFDGALYRLSLSWHLLRFDLNKVGVRAIELPLTESGRLTVIGCIGVFMGRLCYAKKDSFWLFIWSLEEDCKAMEWTLKYNICMVNLVMDMVRSKGYDLDYLLWFLPFAFHPISDVIFLSVPLGILSYDLKRTRLEEVYKPRDGVIIDGHFYQAFTCIRFLVSLNHLGKIHSRPTQLTSISQHTKVLSLEMPPDEIPNGGA